MPPRLKNGLLKFKTLELLQFNPSKFITFCYYISFKCPCSLLPVDLLRRATFFRAFGPVIRYIQRQGLFAPLRIRYAFMFYERIQGTGIKVGTPHGTNRCSRHRHSCQSNRTLRQRCHGLGPHARRTDRSNAKR